jgi:probable DNA repair protein
MQSPFEGLVVTVNKRLASELRQRHDAARQAAGQQAWASADILPWDAWLRRCYDALVDAGHVTVDLLEPHHERILWQQTIARDRRGRALLNTLAAARTVQASASLYWDWQLARHPVEQLGGEETRTFLAWQQAFQLRLQNNGQMTRAQWIPHLTAAFEEGLLTPPSRLRHAGFDVLSPAQQTLFETLARVGCTVETLAAEKRESVCRRVEAPDPLVEIRMAAEWADKASRSLPEGRYAVVVPQLNRLKTDIVRIFRQVLSPSDYLGQGTGHSRFNVSLGAPLASSALVDTGLTLLESLHGEQQLVQIGKLLRSPFVGGHAQEGSSRALFDAALREDGMPRITLRRLRARLASAVEHDPRQCPLLLQGIDEALTLLDSLPQTATPAAWVAQLQHLLQAFGWPGDTPLNSTEYQQYERFKRLLSEFSTLTKVAPSMSLPHAVAQLRSLADDTVFQAESTAASIQVLGPLEAAGMAFDGIWLLGMHDQAWPPPAQPDPLLPVGLQRELGMPHASAERELAFAKTLTDKLRSNCEQVIASCALNDGDVTLRPSPLIVDWAMQGEVAAAVPPLPLYAACDRPGPTETLPPPVASPIAGKLSGGSGLLAAQAACPFRSVAQFRLGAGPLAEPSTSADPALLGNLVHELLQRIWQRLGDSTRLASCDRVQAEQLAEQLAADVLADVGRQRPDLFTPRYRDIEAKRLARLVADWLDVERTRQQPFRVAALEQRRSATLGALELVTRADRIDQLEDGTHLVIDYKTGRRVSTDGWFDDRLNEPQLPLYCVADGETVVGALLARVRNDASGCRFVGLSQRADVAQGVELADGETTAEWQHTMARWRQSLEALAGEISSGRADPTPSREACEYCPLGALCRVAETHLEDGDE